MRSHEFPCHWANKWQEKGQHPVFYAYPLGDDMKGTLGGLVCLMFACFGLNLSPGC